MTKNINYSSYLLPGLVILVSAILRFWGIDSFSLSNDELSAVIRLNYPDFTSLVADGIVATDPHPGGVQVFLYFWTKVFGISPLALRLPFAMASTLSLVFIYLTFKDWFGKQSAILSTAVFGMVAFSIIHGQLARPYAIGILTVWVFVWVWTKIIFHQSKKPLHLILYMLAGALSCYTHYYAALLVGVIGFVGIYPAIRKKVLKLYLLLSFTSVLLFAPHLGITMLQLSRGSLTSWISQADSEFLFDHIFRLLNESYLLLALVSLFLIMGIFLISRKLILKTTFTLLSLLFFLLPILIGYIYSEFFGSALMDRVLYFSSPFFFGLVFSHFPDFEKGKFYGLLTLMMAATIFSTIFVQHFFERRYTENFKGLADRIIEERAENGNGNSFFIGNFNSTEYVNYYLEPKANFVMSSLDSDSLLGEYQRIIEKRYPEDFTMFWACKYQPIASIEYAKSLYGLNRVEEVFFNSGYWHFEANAIGRDTLLYEVIAGKDSMDEDIEFYNIFKSAVIDLSEKEVMNVACKFTANDPANVHLVFTVSSEEGEVVSWRGHSFENYSIGDSGEIFQSVKIDNKWQESDVLSIYIWNPGKSNVMLEDLILSSFKDSHYVQLY